MNLYFMLTMRIRIIILEQTLNNNKSDSRDFVVGANYVDWKLDKSTIIKRYYYIHDYQSISELAKSFNIDYNISWEMQNWFITFTKK